jgi:hypothetical protein
MNIKSTRSSGNNPITGGADYFTPVSGGQRNIAVAVNVGLEQPGGPQVDYQTSGEDDAETRELVETAIPDGWAVDWPSAKKIRNEGIYRARLVKKAK